MKKTVLNKNKHYLLLIVLIVVIIGALPLGGMLRGVIFTVPGDQDSNPPDFNLPSENNDQSGSDLRIVDHEVKNSIFDPYDDQEAEITFTINKDARMTLEIRDEDNEEVVTVIDNRSYDAGEYTVNWDGDDRFGDTVDEGEYEYRLIARIGEESDREEGKIYVRKGFEPDEEDETADPRLKNVYVTKDEFDPDLEKNFIVFTLTADADVRGQIFDRDDKEVYEFIDENDMVPGTYSIKLDEDELSGEDNNLTYTLYASNSRDSDKHEGEIRINQESENRSNKPNIFKDFSNGTPFKPGPQNKLAVSFKLDKEAEVTLEIRDGEFVIDVPVDDMELEEGSHTLYWDGRDKDNDVVGTGSYQYKLLAGNFKGRDTEWGNFSIETSGKNSGGDSFQNCAGFSDVDSSHRYCDAIKWAKDNGVVEGFQDGSFKPDVTVSRAEAVKMILETFKVNTISGRGDNLGFSDVGRYEWYTDYIKSALSLGIVRGYEDGTFRPNRQVLRAEGFIIMLNTARAKDGVIIPSQFYGQPYYDVPNNESTRWFINEAWFAQEHDLSDSEDYLYPLSYMTRGEMADMLHRYDQAGF